jgi:hypothetical protein
MQKLQQKATSSRIWNVPRSLYVEQLESEGVLGADTQVGYPERAEQPYAWLILRKASPGYTVAATDFEAVLQSTFRFTQPGNVQDSDGNAPRLQGHVRPAG